MEIRKEGWKIIINENEIGEALKWRIVNELRKRPVLARFLFYIFLNEPCTITELTRFATGLEKTIYHRRQVQRFVNKLKELNLVSWITPRDFMNSDCNNELYLKAKEKYNELIRRSVNLDRILNKIKLTRFVFVTEYGKNFFDVVKSIIHEHFGGKIKIEKVRE